MLPSIWAAPFSNGKPTRYKDIDDEEVDKETFFAFRDLYSKMYGNVYVEYLPDENGQWWFKLRKPDEKKSVWPSEKNK